MEQTLNTREITVNKNVRNFVLGIMFVCSLLTGLVSGTFLSFVIVCCMGFLLLIDELYLAFPFVLFYNSFYGLFLGVSLFRIFSLLYILSRLLRMNIIKKFEYRIFVPVLVYFIYLIAVYSPISTSRAVFIFIDVICCALFVTGEIKQDKNKLKTLFSVYALVALCSYCTGVILGNSLEMIEGNALNFTEYSRFMATFEDPNYMGFFFTVAIFALVVLKLFKPALRTIIVIALYVMMLASLSITAIVVNIVLWLIYLAVTKKLNISTIILIIIALGLCVFLYYYGLENRDTPIIGDLAYRLEQKIASINESDMGGLTTGRTGLTMQHLEYFASLPFLNKLFGGVMVNTYYIDKTFSGAAHNEYADMLLNIGIIGTLLMLGYFISTFVRYYKEYQKSKDEKNLFLFMLKVLWAAYAFTLTLFLDYRFMFMFLI